MNNADITISQAMPGLAKALDESIENLSGEQRGFLLVVFNSESDGHMNYVSNCNRNQVMNALKSLITKWEAGELDTPIHKKH